MLWKVLLTGQPGAFNMIGLAIGLLNSIIPSKTVNELMFNSERVGIASEHYEEARHSFSSDYYLANQCTKYQTFINMKEGHIMNSTFTQLDSTKAKQKTL